MNDVVWSIVGLMIDVAPCNALPIHQVSDEAALTCTLPNGSFGVSEPYDIDDI